MVSFEPLRFYKEIRCCARLGLGGDKKMSSNRVLIVS